MSNYYFKGIPVTTILNSGSTTAPGYSFSYKEASKSNSKANPINYKYDGTDIGSNAEAKYEIISNSGTLTIPTGATAYRFVGKGGGGAGGHGGGGALAFAGPDMWKSGGDGGYGGTGGYVYTSGTIPAGTTTMEAFIGAAGALDGNVGAKSLAPDGPATGGTGGTGGDGGTTYLQINDLNTAAAMGGGGGTGGPGGSATGPGSTADPARPKAGAGTSGTSYAANTINNDWDTFGIEKSGVAGNRGTGGTSIGGNNAPGGGDQCEDGNAAGANATKGQGYIIWLYE